jgi:hypothetical protein
MQEQAEALLVVMEKRGCVWPEGGIYTYGSGEVGSVVA